MNENATVITAYANVREEPSQRSELFSQLLLGTPVKIQEEKKTWRNCLFEDGNAGWIYHSQIKTGESPLLELSDAKKQICTEIANTVFAEPTADSLPIMTLSWGTTVAVRNHKRRWYLIALPDGRTGWMWSGTSKPLVEIAGTAEQICADALQFVGIPYLWGGTTSFGMDCSGLVQLVYGKNGYLLPRNSSQQAESGSVIEKSELLPADLLFFGKDTVDHVAISLGGNLVLHSSMGRGEVRLDSLNKKDSNYNRTLAENYSHACRVIN